ncbi:MAG: hypothetical protein JXB39_10325, partial [Deltaproteobacteria bacterium]|nr:hypothetical protein [Deltaproteobacteria bacterium]
MSLLLLLPLLLAPLWADDALCIACCQNAGMVTCRPQLPLFGEGSRATVEGDGFRIQGLWSLTCTGEARFDGEATEVTTTRPTDGDVILDGIALPQLVCFQKSCTLPPDACLRSEAHLRVRLVDCVDGLPLSGDRLRRSAPPPQVEEILPQVPPATRDPDTGSDVSEDVPPSEGLPPS